MMTFLLLASHQTDAVRGAVVALAVFSFCYFARALNLL